MKFLGRKRHSRSYSYHDYLLWNSYLKRYLPQTQNARVIEIGSAPGNFLVRAKQEFGLEPYGVELSYYGVELNRRLFAQHNIKPENVIHADFLDEKFQLDYEERFDVVVSRGFIEHFTDAKSIVEKHIKLLRKGGTLIISVPNYRGFYRIWEWLFDREHLLEHNLSIMKKSRFQDLFKSDRLLPLFCGYYGTFTFRLLGAKNRGVLKLPLYFCHHVMDPVVSLVLRLLFRYKGAESSIFSPNLLYVGIRI